MNNKRIIKLEICANGINDVLKLKNLDVDRIELNSALELGGLTPSIETLKYAKNTLKNKLIICTVRNRTGSYFYTDEEKEIMLNDARNLIEAGADGIAFGSLIDDWELDFEMFNKMKEIVRDKILICNNCFDSIENKDKAIQQLIKIGVERINLMGLVHYETNLHIIKFLNEKYGEKIEFQVSDKIITENNIYEIINNTHVSNIRCMPVMEQRDIVTKDIYLTVCIDKIKNIIEILNDNFNNKPL